MAFAKENEDRYSVKPYGFRFEPLVQACRRSRPDFQSEKVDVLSGLNNLRQIFKFVSGTDWQPFRADIQMIGKTMMMTRWEKDLNSMTHTSLCRGYGQGFEKVCTKQEEKAREATSHHRIVNYALGDLSVVVQYQADLRDCSFFSEEPDRTALRLLKNTSGALSSQDQARLQHESTDRSVLMLDIANIGVTHTIDCLLEVKSRDHKNNSTDDILAQIWLSGYHNLYLARHVRGCFDASGVQHKNVQEDLVLWQSRHEEDVGAVQSILHTIRHTLQGDRMFHSAKKYALVLEHEDGKSVLKLWRRNGGQEMLSKNLMQSFWAH